MDVVDSSFPSRENIKNIEKRPGYCRVNLSIILQTAATVVVRCARINKTKVS